jgi:serine protease Do
VKHAARAGLLAIAVCAASLHAAGIGGGGGAPQAHAQGYLGVDVRDVAEEQVSSLRLKDVRWAEIVQVDHDAPAGKVGLREHDVVLQLNGQAIAGQDQVRRMLRELAPGRTVVLTISRDGQQMTFTAVMSNREIVERQAWERHMTVPDPGLSGSLGEGAGASGEAFLAGSPVSEAAAPGSVSRGFLGTILMSPAYTGAMLEMMGPQLAGFFGAPSGLGLLVRDVQPNSPASLAGLRAGDVVLRANSLALRKTTDWARLMQENRGRAVTIVVIRDKKEQTLTLVPDAKRRSRLDMPGAQPGTAEVASRTAL